MDEDYFALNEAYFTVLIKTTNKNVKDLKFDQKDRQLQTIIKTFAQQLSYETLAEFLKVEAIQRLWSVYQKSDHLKHIRSLLPEDKKRNFYQSVRDNELLEYFD